MIRSLPSMARSCTTTKVLEIENGDTRSWVFCRLLIEEVLAQLMGEAGGEFGHPAMMILVNACPIGRHGPTIQCSCPREK